VKKSNKSPKVMTTTEAHRSIAQKNLKAALTHPTIVLYLKKYMKEANSEYLLDFYKEVTIFRDVHKHSSKIQSGRNSYVYICILGLL
jgi:hypothetical protein